MRDSQVPIAMSAFGDKVTRAAWRAKPSWFVVATEDGAIDPKLLRKTATRIGAETVEVKGSHVVFLSRPEAIANVIDKAAKTAASKAQ
jgi:pimeloyl-ACP methyl ester carboxylesterase